MFHYTFLQKQNALLLMRGYLTFLQTTAFKQFSEQIRETEKLPHLPMLYPGALYLFTSAGRLELT